MAEIPHLTRTFDAQPDGVTFDFNGSCSRLDALATGVTLLLGKNGAGKSSLLRSLQTFGTPQHATFPRVTLHFRLPSIDETLSYWSFVDDILSGQSKVQAEAIEQGHEFFDGIRLATGYAMTGDLWNRRRLNLPVVELVIDSLDRSYEGFKFSIGSAIYSAPALLRMMMVPEKEVLAFERRQTRLKSEIESPPDESGTNWEEYSRRLDYRLYFCEFILALMRRSRLNGTFRHEDEYVDGVAWPPNDEWFEDDDKKALVVAALREVFENGEIDVTTTPLRSSWSFAQDEREDEYLCNISFTAAPTLDSRFAEFVKVSDAMVAEHDRLYPAINLGSGITFYQSQPRTFPHDIFQLIPSSNRRAAISLPVRHHSGHKVFNDASHCFLNCRSLPGRVTVEDVSKLLQSMTSWMFHIQEPEFSKDSATSETEDSPRDHLLEVGGVWFGRTAVEELLRQASDALRELDIGVFELGIEVLPRKGVLDPSILRSPDELPTSPALLFRELSDSQWKSLDKASDGQLATIFVVTQLLQLLGPLEPNRLRPAMSLLLADEFDRYLHPTTAERLLSFMHQRARFSGVSVIASTHSQLLFTSALTRSCPRLFAERDLSGRFELSTTPRADLFGQANLLGTAESRARSLKRVHVVAEGEIDEAVIRHLLDHTVVPLGDLELIPISGILNLEPIWRTSLQFLTAPILVVYDKRSSGFEDVWEKHVRINPIDYREQKELRKLEQLVRQQKSERPPPNGTAELDSLLTLARATLNSSRVTDVRGQVARIHFFGFDVPDILWYLPIELFKKQAELEGPRAWVPDGSDSWDNLLADSNLRSPGTEFKKRFGITLVRVRAVLEAMSARDFPLADPRLMELVAAVLGLLESDNDPRSLN